MSLYVALAIVAAIGILARLRYGPNTIPYVAAALLAVLFLYCPTRFHSGFGEWPGVNPATVQGKLDQLAEILSFGLLFTAAWIYRSASRKGSE